jgi:hypothetical protein
MSVTTCVNEREGLDQLLSRTSEFAAPYDNNDI